MTCWDELAPVLVRLRDEQPGSLVSFPTPEVADGREPPFLISLAPWAVGAAAELHRQFGPAVVLTVGALPYPPGREHQPVRDDGQPAELLDPQQLTAELDGAAVVRTGRSLRHGLLVRNHTERERHLATNGQLLGQVVDLLTGERVGGFAGFLAAPLVVVRIAAGQTEQVPLLIGTASFVPRLGYAVPPGQWGVLTTLELDLGLDLGQGPADPGSRRTPVMPLTITG